MIDDGRATNSVDDFGRRKLHIESNGVTIGGIVVYHWNLLYDRFYLKPSGHPLREFIEIIREDRCLHDLKVDVDPFVKPRNHKEVIEQVIIPITCQCLLGNNAGVDVVFDE